MFDLSSLTGARQKNILRRQPLDRLKTRSPILPVTTYVFLPKGRSIMFASSRIISRPLAPAQTAV